LKPIDSGIGDADGSGLYERIGAFLAEHRLSPEPAHYNFAWLVINAPGGPLAAAVTSLTDGGFRLSRDDIETLGGKAIAGAPLTVVPRAGPAPGSAPVPAPASAPVPVAAPDTDALIARTQLQVEGFADTMRAMHAETQHFGRDLAASAAAIDAIGAAAGIKDIAHITAAMVARVEDAERRLDAATRETSDLRAALDEARGSARTDPLTDLPNRRAFDEAFDARLPDRPCSVAICDIDHFKQVNDRFGHAVGDRVLRAIGQTLASECEGHLVARYGGEEFVLVVDGDATTAQAAIERARVTIAQKRFRSRDTGELIGIVTISAGIAEIAAGETRDAVLARADAAMYEAKDAGRNCVKISAADWRILP